MSDIDPDADSISNSSNAHGDEAMISTNVREFCDRLRANDPRILNYNFVFDPSRDLYGCSEAECIAVFQALKENTSVKHIDFRILFYQRHYTKKSAFVAAEYVESSKTLQTLNLSDSRPQYSHEVREMSCLLLRALSRNTSVTKLIIDTEIVKFASVAFEELLTRTQTLQKLESMGSRNEAFDEAQIDAIASGFANNTTLRDLIFNSWRETDLATVLTALKRHPALKKIHFSARHNYLPSLSGLEVLLRSQDSKVKELVIEQVDNRTAGLHPVLQELRHNTTVTILAIHHSEDLQQLTAVLRQNTVLQSLDLDSSALGSAGLAEIAPAPYRNKAIKTLDLSGYSLDDIVSANVLRDLIRRNKTISSLCLAGNAFGRNAAATQSILEGLRCNTALQQLDLSGCGLDDRGLSVLANALVARNASMVKLILYNNKITSVGLQALFDDTVEAVKTLTELCHHYNPVRSEGAIILADV